MNAFRSIMALADGVHFSDRLRAAVDVVGISSFVTLLENTQDYRRDHRPVWYMNALNEGHGYRKKENRDIYQQATVVFLTQYLVGE